MPQPPAARLSVVGGGAALMVGCAIAALAGTVGWSDLTRGSLIVPFAPLTALAILIAGAYWTYRVRPSVGDSIGALLVVELVTFGIVATIAGLLFNLVVVMFWATASLCFAPSWFLASVIGRAMQARRN